MGRVDLVLRRGLLAELAENVALSLTRGARVVVTGRLEQRTYDTEDGERRSKVEVVANDIGASLRYATLDIERVVRRVPATEPHDAPGADADMAAEQDQ